MMSDRELLALHSVIIPPRPRRRHVSETPFAVPMQQIAATVARMAHLRGRNPLMAPRRDQHTAFARQLAMYLCREVTHASFPIIGQFFGRDHSTVLHACKTITARACAQPEFAEKLKALVEELRPLVGPFWNIAA
jgi:chromosomal replication initiator protein